MNTEFTREKEKREKEGEEGNGAKEGRLLDAVMLSKLTSCLLQKKKTDKA